jgi:hypothetical protein
MGLYPCVWRYSPAASERDGGSCGETGTEVSLELGLREKRNTFGPVLGSKELGEAEDLCHHR